MADAEPKAGPSEAAAPSTNMPVSTAAVRVKAPEFTESSAGAWFLIMEAQFRLGRLTIDSTKFYHVLSSLPASLIERLPMEAKTSESYDALKAAVTEHVEKSKPELFESLITEYTLTGRPSIYLSQLRTTAGKVGVGDDFVRHKFMQSLPATIAPVLAAQPTLNLEGLGRLADELVSLVGKNTHQSSHVTTACSYSPKINRSPNMGLQPFHDKQRPRVCRSHIFFGREARNCKPWCAWPDKNRCRIEPASRSNSPAPPTPAPRENGKGAR